MGASCSMPEPDEPEVTVVIVNQDGTQQGNQQPQVTQQPKKNPGPAPTYGQPPPPQYGQPTAQYGQVPYYGAPSAGPIRPHPYGDTYSGQGAGQPPPYGYGPPPTPSTYPHANQYGQQPYGPPQGYHQYQYGPGYGPPPPPYPFGPPPPPPCPLPQPPPGPGVQAAYPMGPSTFPPTNQYSQNQGYNSPYSPGTSPPPPPYPFGPPPAPPCPLPQPPPGPAVSSLAPSESMTSAIAGMITNQILEKIQKQEQEEQKSQFPKPKSLSKGPMTLDGPTGGSTLGAFCSEKVAPLVQPSLLATMKSSVKVAPSSKEGSSTVVAQKSFVDESKLNDGFDRHWIDHLDHYDSIPDLLKITDPKYKDFYAQLITETCGLVKQSSTQDLMEQYSKSRDAKDAAAPPEGEPLIQNSKNSRASSNFNDATSAVSQVGASSIFGSLKVTGNNANQPATSGKSRLPFKAVPLRSNKSKSSGRSSTARPKSVSPSGNSSKPSSAKSTKSDPIGSRFSEKGSQQTALKAKPVTGETKKEDSTFFALPSFTTNASSGGASVGSSSLDKPESKSGQNDQKKTPNSKAPKNSSKRPSSVRSVRSNKSTKSLKSSCTSKNDKPKSQNEDDASSLSNPNSKKSNEKDKRESSEDLSSKLNPENQNRQKKN